MTPPAASPLVLEPILDVVTALWLNALAIAAGDLTDLYPVDLELAARYFALYPPVARA